MNKTIQQTFLFICSLILWSLVGSEMRLSKVLQLTYYMMKPRSYNPGSQLQFDRIPHSLLDMPPARPKLQQPKCVYVQSRTLPTIAFEKRSTGVEDETVNWGCKEELWSEQEEQRGLSRNDTVLSFVVKGGQLVEDDYRVMELEGKYREAMSIMGDSFLSSFTSGDEIEEKDSNVSEQVHYVRVPTKSHKNSTTNNSFTCMTRETLDEECVYGPTVPKSCEKLKDSEKKTSSSNSPESPKPSVQDSHYHDIIGIARNFFKPELKNRQRGWLGEASLASRLLI